MESYTSGKRLQYLNTGLSGPQRPHPGTQGPPAAAPRPTHTPTQPTHPRPRTVRGTEAPPRTVRARGAPPLTCTTWWALVSSSTSSVRAAQQAATKTAKHQVFRAHGYTGMVTSALRELHWQSHSSKNTNFLGLPWWTSDQDCTFPLQRARV